MLSDAQGCSVGEEARRIAEQKLPDAAMERDSLSVAPIWCCRRAAEIRVVWS
jgi:hypothetical protein